MTESWLFGIYVLYLENKLDKLFMKEIKRISDYFDALKHIHKLRDKIQNVDIYNE